MCLGSLLLSPETIVKVGAHLRAEDFYDHRHRLIYAAMLSINRRGGALDWVSVAQEIDKAGKIENIGGELYIAGLRDCVPTGLNVMGYAQDVRAMALRRRLIEAAQDIARLAYAQGVPINDVVAKAQAAITSAADDGRGYANMTWSEALAGFTEELEQYIYADKAPDTFNFGVKDLDATLGDALLPGNMGIIAAKKKRGKSTLMRQHMMRNAKAGYPCAIFSFEEREFNIAKSVLSRESLQEISRYKLRQMREAGDEVGVARILQSINQAAVRVAGFNIHPFMSAGWRVEQVCMQMEYLARVHGVKVFEVDYVQLIRAEGRESRRLELASISSQISTTVKSLTAKGHPCFALLGSQVNDEGRTREAEDIENDCDFKILIDPVEVSQPIASGRYPVTLNVELNRHGPAGKVEATFDKPRSNFGGVAA
jgi:replicative DNA helicase